MLRVAAGKTLKHRIRRTKETQAGPFLMHLMVYEALHQKVLYEDDSIEVDSYRNITKNKWITHETFHSLTFFD